MPIANINNASIYYESAGTGKTLVFLHAGIADSRMWNAQFELFSKTHHCVRFDWRGFGQSSIVDSEFSPTEDLHALLDYLNIESATLIGCSKGGSIAMDYTVLHPERVSGLVMVASNPTGFEFAGYIPPLWEKIKAAWEARDVELTAKLEIDMWVVSEHREKIDPEIYDLAVEMNTIVLRNEKKSTGKERKSDLKAVEHLKDINVPVLVIMGALDDPDMGEAGKHMVETIPNATSVTIDDSAHLPSMEQPQAFNEALEAFLTSSGI